MTSQSCSMVTKVFQDPEPRIESRIRLLSLVQADGRFIEHIEDTCKL